MNTYYIQHHGIKGQKWGVRRFQNEDGSLTSAGESRYGNEFKTRFGLHDRQRLAESQRLYKVSKQAYKQAKREYKRDRNVDKLNDARNDREKKRRDVVAKQALYDDTGLGQLETAAKSVADVVIFSTLTPLALKGLSKTVLGQEALTDALSEFSDSKISSGTETAAIAIGMAAVKAIMARR